MQKIILVWFGLVVVVSVTYILNVRAYISIHVCWHFRGLIKGIILGVVGIVGSVGCGVIFVMG